MTDLAQSARLDQGQLSRIERGLRPPPDIYPNVQLIAEKFGFEPTSHQYRELMGSAIEERFGSNAPPSPTLHFLVAPKGSRVMGLRGLRPEVVDPDSATGQYYRSIGSVVSSHEQGPNPGITPAGTAQPPNSLERLFAAVLPPGVEVISFRCDADKVQAVLRTPDGSELELKVAQRKKRLGKKPRKEAAPAEGNQ
jgi:hypothetical protein